MRIGCLNVGGWSLKDPENKLFREQTVIKSNCDVFCVVETFLKNKQPYKSMDIRLSVITEDICTRGRNAALVVWGCFYVALY